MNVTPPPRVVLSQLIRSYLWITDIARIGSSSPNPMEREAFVALRAHADEQLDLLLAASDDPEKRGDTPPTET